MSSKYERVKIERPSAKSFLAFFLLPQFWRSMAHFGNIGPTFVQTLATMFAQAGLLPLNHPATRLGGTDSEGNKYKTAHLLGEAWYNLRARPNMGFYQWGLFGSIIMMFVSMVFAGILAIAYLLGGTVAKAQIFQLPAATDFSTVPGGAAGLFDRRDPGAIAGHSGDLAIGILDKVLRQGAQGTGGTMQNAIAPMFGTYSTAVLVIASIVVFWSIVSIVIDSARTGQLGGGRHNMVWTPIRFVFALGLLVPIGGGFNSGQLIVMKLAEWGSNLGSNMWTAYVTGKSDTNLLVDVVETSNPVPSLLQPMVDTLTCVQANNIASEVALGSAAFSVGNYMGTALSWAKPPAAGAWQPMSNVGAWGNPHPQYVRPNINQQQLMDNSPAITINFGNMANPSLCGGITLPNPQGSDIINWDPTDSNYPAAVGAGDGQIQLNTGVAYGAPYDEIAQFKADVRNAEWNIVSGLLPDLYGFACHLASLNQQADPTTYANSCPAGGAIGFGAVGPSFGYTGGGGCNGLSGGYDGQFPNVACLSEFVTRFSTARVAAVTTARDNNLYPYLAPAGPFVAESLRQGWAGMGAWYFKIAGINRTFNESFQVDTQGDGKSAAQTGAEGAAEEESCPRFWSDPIGAIKCGVGSVVSTALGPLKKMMDFGANLWNNLTSDFPINFSNAFSIDSGTKVIKWILKKMMIGSDGNLAVFGDNQPAAMLVKVGGYNSTVHPMASLSKAGSDIIDKAILIYGAIAFLSLFAGLPYVGGAITALVAGPVGSFLGMIASFGLMPGLMLLYYVPLIPWTKCMFAVVAWITSVVEAVATIPVVALAHLSTEGEGLAGPMAKGAYIGWLNLLLRPGLVVIGFVMGNLIFEAMILYLNDTFERSIGNLGSGGYGVIDQVVNTYIYVFAAYALVNASFKLVDIIPNSTMSWLGTGPHAETFAGEASQTEGFIKQNMGEMAQGIGQYAGGAAASAGMLTGGTAAGIGSGLNALRQGQGLRAAGSALSRGLNKGAGRSLKRT